MLVWLRAHILRNRTSKLGWWQHLSILEIIKTKCNFGMCRILHFVAWQIKLSDNSRRFWKVTRWNIVSEWVATCILLAPLVHQEIRQHLPCISTIHYVGIILVRHDKYGEFASSNIFVVSEWRHQDIRCDYLSMLELCYMMLKWYYI